MKRNNLILLTIALLVSCVLAGAKSKTKDNSRIYAPIKHQKYYKCERELFGYKPKFKPGTISFSNNNTPYIISPGNKTVIQTLDKNGKWINLDFGKAIKRSFPKWNGVINTSASGNRRITFDIDGDAYFYAATGRSNLGRALLLYSKNKCRDWLVYELPYLEHGRLEVNDTFNLKKYPPPILFYSIRNRPKGELMMVLPHKNKNGTLTLSRPISIAKDSATLPPHSGDGNYCVSVGDNVHIVWTTSKSRSAKGNSHYALTYNRKKGTISSRVYIGQSNEHANKPDSHCQPVITVDSKGFLHVILGTHHSPFKYTRSNQPDSTAGWSKPESFGVLKKKAGEGSYTYPSINCDPQDNIHVISRWAGVSYYFALVYNKRTHNGKWMKQQMLVFPFRNMYGCWYHKVSIDHSGRIFVYYINYRNQLDKKTVDAYDKKWPEDRIKQGKILQSPSNWYLNAKPHSPAILMSNDYGKSWYLGTTLDFLSGIEKW